MGSLFKFDEKNKTESFLIGTDEAGRGPLAGPVVAAAVCFRDLNKNTIKLLAKLNDSKQLTEKQREELYPVIIDNSVYEITVIDVEEIERINILRSSLKAMKISCEKVIQKVGDDVEVFVDGNKKIPEFKFKQTTIVKGDGKSASVAAASILAKVFRDNIMCKLSEQYPQYDWINNKGYGTKKHVEAIKEHGITEFHRKSFLKKILAEETEQQLMLEF